MSAQNTHHIPAFDHVFGSFHLIVSALIVIYLILSFLCISGEKGSTWRLCGDVKKKIGEPSLNVVTLLRSYEMQPTSVNVATFQRRNVDGIQSTSFLWYIKKKNDKNKGGSTRSKTKTTTLGDWRNRVIVVFHIFFLELLLIKMIVIIIMMF